MELVDQLCKKLGISEEQARGGVGLVLNLLESKLEAKDFGKVAKAVPDAGSLQQEAPAAGGLMGALAGLAGQLGGEKGAQLGNLAQLASGFGKLNLSKETVAQFVPVLIQLLSSRGGKALQEILLKALK